MLAAKPSAMPAEQREALDRLDQSMGRVDKALRDLEKERQLEEELLRRFKEINRPGLRPGLKLPLPRPPGPWDFLGDMIFYLAVPGFVNTSGNGPCFEASCIGAFSRGTQRFGCAPPPPYCFSPLPIGVMPAGYANRQAAIAAMGVTETHWMEWWTTASNPLTYVVGRIYGPLAAGDNIGIDPTYKFIPRVEGFPPGFPGAVVADPNMIPQQQAEEQPDPKDQTRTKPKPGEDDDEVAPRNGRFMIWSWTATDTRTGPTPRPAPKPVPRPGVAMLPPAPSRARENMKERKVSPQLHGLLRGAAWLFDLYTESNDFITAIWQALPRRIRCGELRYGPRGNPYRVGGLRRRKGDALGKAEDVFRHLDEVDIGQAILNLAANHLEDHAIGKSQQRLLELAGGYESNSNHAGVTSLRSALRDAKRDMDRYRATLPREAKGGCR